jgi:acylphosphatase
MNETPSPHRETIRVIYSGRVQGVGFRFTTRDIATRFPVTGFVRNQPDGSVELVAQGDSAAVRGFLDAVTERFRWNIRGCDESLVTDETELNSFEIRR